MFVALAAIPVIAGINGYKSPVVASGPSNNEACVMAQTFVEGRLKAPSTARFASCRPPDTRISHSGSSWVVTSWVDADNSFGAKIRNNYTVQMSYSPAGQMWTPVDVTLASR